MRPSHGWILAVALLVFSTVPSVDARQAEAVDFLIRPYLFTRDSGKALGLAWQYRSRLPEGARSEVTITREDRTVAVVAAENDEGLQHVTLPIGACGYGAGLKYQVTGQADQQEIAEVPCADAGAIAKFTFISDSQEGDGFVRDLAAEIKKFPGTAILNAGDIVHKGNEHKQWVGYFDAMSSVGRSRPLFMAMGNHEYVGDLDAPLWKRFFRVPAHDSRYVAYLGQMRLLVINSGFADDPSMVEPQLAWLRAELARPFDGWTAVMFHHAAYSVGIANSAMNPRGEWRILQERFVPIFETMGVDLVLNGHTHIFERSIKQGVHYLVAGPAGGKMGIPGNTNPWTILSDRVRTMTHFEVDARNLRAVTYDENGRKIDELRLQK